MGTRRDPHFSAERTFKIDVKRFGASLPREDVQAAIEQLRGLELAGKVNLPRPDNVLSVHEYWGRYHAQRASGHLKTVRATRLTDRSLPAPTRPVAPLVSLRMLCEERRGVR